VRIPALVVLTLLVGCGSVAYRPELMSPRAVVLETPDAHQDALFECGLAAISALTGYYGLEIPEMRQQELAALAAESHGLSGAELRQVLEECGLEVYLFEGKLQGGPTGLQDNVLARRPPLVMTAETGFNHYSLVVGFDPDDGSLVLLDPVRGRVIEQAADFERRWIATQRFLLLAVPR
jgi:ABC-type bacteriocin/lantibiotic exporter with double-glycine peptidase domain